jgi:hypothetical protein
MIETWRWSWQSVMLGGMLLGCQAARTPESEAVLPAAGEHATAGAAAVAPGGGGAPSETSGIGGNAPEPAPPGTNGIGGNDTGSGGTAGGAAGNGSAGASGRDDDSQSGEEQRYAILIEPAWSSASR